MSKLTVKTLTWNIKRDVYNDWDEQGHKVIAHIDRAVNDGVTVLILQECSYSQAADICGHLGEHWSWSRDRNHNVVCWDQKTWTLEKERAWDLRGSQKRALLVLKLRHKSGRYCWFGSTHLASRDQPQRESQARQVAAKLRNYWWLVLGGDWNNESGYSRGPRATLKRAGWRGVLNPLGKNRPDTFGGQTAKKSDDKSLDDVWGKPKWVTFGKPEVIDTTASDHRPIIVTATIDTTNQKG